MTVVLDPTGDAAQVTTELAPRPPSLDGLVVGYLDNGKPNSDRFLDQLRTRFPSVLSVVTSRKPNIGRVAPTSLIQDLAARCDVVITGVGDCAGCCSCTVQDGIALERLGVPTYVVCTSDLLTIAKIAATTAGVPDYPFTVIDHPLGALTDDQLACRATQAHAQITAALGA
jgi:hypothetical protein